MGTKVFYTFLDDGRSLDVMKMIERLPCPLLVQVLVQYEFILYVQKVLSIIISKSLYKNGHESHA